MGNLIHKGKGTFTVVENTIFFDSHVSMKAKGIYCQIRSLENNPDWVFTIRGFSKLAKDGTDAINAGIKELEGHGYIIRARKRDSGGRFCEASDALWITLDDPTMYESVTDELAADGYAVISKFKRSDAKKNDQATRNSEEPQGRDAEVTKPQVATRTGKSGSGKSRSGLSASGETGSGKSDTINNSSDKTTHSISLGEADDGVEAPKRGKGKGNERKSRTEEQFPEPFERLCKLSIKPVKALSFKQACYESWRKRLMEGYLPDAIVAAYEDYAKDYREQNGDDPAFAKNLARWLKDEGGLEDYADKPIDPTLSDEQGNPLSMEELAQADESFGKLWKRMMSRRSVIRTIVRDQSPDADDQEIERAALDDSAYGRYRAQCESRYRNYLDSRSMIAENGDKR